MIACAVYDLSKRYSKGDILANDKVSFELRAGDIFGLLGPNGAGKTTLVRQIMGLVRPTAGSISIFGRDVVAKPDLVPNLVSYMTQRPTALADLTLREALVVTGRLRGQTSRAARKQSDSLIDEFDLSALSNRVLGKQSGGQQRLAGFCIALMGNRPILILDEPTNDLDPMYRKAVWDKLGELNSRLGTTIILVTHNVAEAELVLNTVGIINQGKITAMGSVGELKARVDQAVRLELLFKAKVEQTKQMCLLEENLAGHVKNISGNRWLALVARGDAPKEINSVLAAIGLENLDDFRIQLPTLEDVYFQLGGGEQLADIS